MKRDEAKRLANEAIEELRQSLEAGHSDTLVRYLNVMSKFHNYSWNNCVLIGVQMAVTQCDTFQGLRFER